MTRVCLGVTAAVGGLALIWFALTLIGLGMFCFDGALFAELSDHTSMTPDCFVVRVSDWINPQLWLLGNLSFAVLLSLWAQATAYGLLRSRSWSKTSSLVGAIAGILYFFEIAIAFPEFSTDSIVGVAVLACFILGSLVVPRPATLA
jgi:hypothetical protein